MKSSALSGWVLGLGMLAACGGGEGDGPRGTESGGSGGSGSVPTAAGTMSMGLGGTVTAAGSPSTGGTLAGTGGAPPKVCGPDWVGGTMYKVGDIVQYKGQYYIAEEDNPGYDPIISTFFWDPYNCSDGGGSAGSPSTGGVGGGDNKPPLGESSFDDIVSEQQFNEFFPNRNGFYTYQGLVDASKYYPAFAGTGDMDVRKREAAAFLGNVARETGELVFIEQIQKDVLCQERANCPCAPGKQYYGRGPLQISWNYNYCAAGKALGLDLGNNPDQVAQDATIAWEAGLWFWMTQSGAGTKTPHAGITEAHSFGETIRSINGGVECDGKDPGAVASRGNFYNRFCQALGVAPGENQGC